MAQRQNCEREEKNERNPMVQGSDGDAAEKAGIAGIRWEIRKVMPEDLPQIAEIEKGIFSRPWSEKGFADSLRQRGTLYLCVSRGPEILGYCGLLQVMDEAEITNVAVKSEARGQGVAMSMLTELLRQGERRGIRGFTLEVRVSNAAAICLYHKLGFCDSGLRKRFYEFPTEDALVMWKRFDESFPHIPGWISDVN